MIDTNETGQKKLREIVAALDEVEWTDWETGFITSVQDRGYERLSPREQGVVGRLYDKMLK